MKLDIGCGGNKQKGFTGVDLCYPTDVKDNVCELKNFEDNSIDEIRAFHLLEHIPDKKVELALTQIYRVLKTGGKLSLQVPNLIWAIHNFLDKLEEERWGFPLKVIFGSQDRKGEFHYTGFSIKRLKRLLEQTGFREIEVWIDNSLKEYNQGVINAIAFK